MADISIYVTSDLTSSERRISPQWDLNYLKSKLELITGIKPQFQSIQYYPFPSSNEYKLIADASNYNEEQDKAINVSQWQISSYTRLHIIDTDPDSELNDLVSKQHRDNDDDDDEDEENEQKDEGFKLTEEEYAKRSDTVLRWKQDNKLGRFDPKFDEEKLKRIEENTTISSSMKIGDRCRVLNIEGERRGAVKFIGRIKQLDDEEQIWIGVEFDEPLGRNDGSIDGKKYFEAKPKHGSFLKPKQVEVGDFPEDDPFASDEEL